MKLAIEHPDYPDALRHLPNPPRVLTTSGPLERRRAIAIVGSRDACPEALVFAHDLAFQLATAGVLVVSGGAVGIDGAAHRGAMAAGGATWVVSPTGKDRLYPPRHKLLFEEIRTSDESRMLWPFDDDANLTEHSFRYRNGVLAALSDGLVLVQAHYKSESRNAAAWARSLRRPVWAVCAAPWMRAFCGSLAEIETEKARPLCSVGRFFKALGLGEPAPAPGVDVAELVVDRSEEISSPVLDPPPAPPEPANAESMNSLEIHVLSSLSARPMHGDQIAAKTGLQSASVTTALLTLSLKDVVVEGPDGFFRRKKAR